MNFWKKNGFLIKSNAKVQLVLILALMFLSLIFLWQLIHLWVVIIAVLGVINLLAIISYRKDITIPLLETVLAREYLRTKEKLFSVNTLVLPQPIIWEKYYLNFLKQLMILFLDSQKSFELFIKGETPFDIKFNAKRQTLAIKAKTEAVKKKYIEEFFDFYKLKKKKIVTASLVASSLITLVIVVFTVLIPLYRLYAATYSWVQTDWSGGASTTAIAVHPGDMAGWNKYYSKDSNISATTALTLTASTTAITHTSAGDFSGTYSNTEGSTGSILLTGSLAFDDLSTAITYYPITFSNTPYSYVLDNYAYYVDSSASNMKIYSLASSANATSGSATLLTTWTTSTALFSSWAENKLGHTYVYLTSANFFTVVDATAHTTTTPVASLRLGVGNNVNITVSGNYAYVGNSNGYVSIIDVTDPTNPQFMASTTVQTGINHPFAQMKVSGNYLYIPVGNYWVSSGNIGLNIVDITNKSAPTFLNHTTTTRAITGVHINGNYAYVYGTYQANNQVMSVIDISNVNAPVIVYSNTAALHVPPYSVSGSGTNIYVAGYTGMEMWDVSSSSTVPASKIVKTDSIAGATANWYSNIISGGSIYITSDKGIYKITPPATYNFVSSTGSYASTGVGYSMASDGNNLYQTRGTNKIWVLDVSPPNTVALLSSSATGLLYGSTIAGNYLYTTESLKMQISNIGTTPTTVYTSGNIFTSVTTDMDVSGNYAYIADGATGLRVVNISSSTNPLVVGTYNSAGTATGIAVSGNYAYLADGTSGLAIIDISSSTNPTIASTTDTTGTATDVVISGNYAYLADSANGLQIYDISTPTAPQSKGNFNPINNVLDVEVIGNYAYLAESSIITIVNIASSTNPVFANSYTCGTTAVNYLTKYNNTLFANCNGESVFSTVSYVPSGNYTSQIIDTTSNLGFATATWTASVPTGTTLSVKIRTSANPDMAGAADWSSCSAIVSGTDISSNNCVTDGQRYVQYYVEYTSDASRVSSPSLDDITINYDVYPASQSLISSVYDTGDTANMIGDILWTETVPAGTNVNFQLRTSADGLTWTDWLGPTSSTDYYSTAVGDHVINPAHNDGVNDRYVQYRVFLTSTGANTPTVSDISLKYVVNAKPEFSQSATASQRTSDGYIAIEYAVRDSDTNSANAACQNCLLPTFQYSLDNGVNWIDITAGLSAGATATTTGISQTTYTTSTVTWNAKAQIDGIYSTTFKIKVKVNDKEGGNNIASSTSATFTVDLKNPIPGSPALMVTATTSPATLALSATDDNTLEMCITLDNTQNNCVPYSATASLALASDPDRVYVIYRDTYKNTYSVNVDTVTTPGNMVIRDVSNISANTYQEFIVWQAAAAGLSPAFASYQVWRSLDGTNYSLVSTINTRTINYYLDQDVVANATYYYKINTVDAGGNTSYFSTVVSDMADGQGGTDTTPPTITGVQVTATTTQSATIVWDTNEPANSTVNFGLSILAVNESQGSVTLTDTATGLGKHSVVLTGLTPNTTYYFEVQSTDIGHITATNNNASEYYSFTTKSGPAISGVTVSSIFNSGATIIWNTDISSDTYVVYSTSSAMTNSTEVGVSELATSHAQRLTGLVTGETYYYYVRSGVATDNNGGSNYNFITASDGVAPVFTISPTASIIIDTKALITWTTNELADSLVEYGTTPGVYTGSELKTTTDLSHALLLSSLATSTKYYYKVTSVDESGNIASTTEANFTTRETLSEESAVLLREAAALATGQAEGSAPAPAVSCGGGGGSSIDRSKPVLTEVKVASISGSSAKVTWKTNKSSWSTVDYGTTENYDQSAISYGMVTDHSVTLNKLLPLTSYYVRANSVDEYGNIGVSDKFTFTTTALNSEEALLGNVTGADDNAVYKAAISSALDIASRLYSKVSLTTLEDSFNSIRSLSNFVPAPILSGEPRVLTTAETATITWRTDKDSNSLVSFASEEVWNKNRAYTQTVGNPADALAIHLVTIENLTPETTYHYQVRSMTSLGNEGKSDDFTFTTKPKQLEISSYTFEKINGATAIFRWLTSIETDAQVKYTPFRNGTLDVQSAKTVKSKNFTVLHEVTVDAFESGIVYEVELSGKDIKGQVASQKISQFSTGEDNFPPTIYQVQTESALSAGKESNVQTIISWLTDEPATSQVFYQKGVGAINDEAWEKTQADPNYSKKHIVVLTKFEPGQIYQFKIQSNDSNGNLGISKVYTILAPKQKESVFQVILKNFEEVFGWTQKINQ